MHCRTTWLLAVMLHAAVVAPLVAAERPNIVIIMADDVGYSDLGCYGSEIRTPHLDRLAAEGLRCTQFYNNAICHMTRASLLTGLYPRRVNSGAPLLSPQMVTVAELLHDAGYQTALSGKWHLGRQSPHLPTDRGFEEYYGLLDGCCNYHNPGRPDPEFEGGRVRVWGRNAERITEFPADFYATDAISDHAIGQIRRFAEARRPFFLHVCYTAAHSPLHAKPADIARYRGKYAQGWDELRRTRRARQLELGLIRPEWEVTPREPEFTAWSDEPNRAWQESLMEVYAAMVDSMDQGIGRILQELKQQRLDENTVVIFLSDNGGCAEQAGGDDPTNIPGPEEHYVSCGAGWGWLQCVPFRRYKAWMHEGGISTPFIVRWPGQVRGGSISRDVGHLVDLLPTCAEIVGLKAPTQRKGQTLLTWEGQSLLPIFLGQAAKPRGPLFWEWSGNRAMRDGPWKLVRDNMVGRWELYDIERDRAEMHDLAQSDPNRVERMSTQWRAWATSTGVDPDKSTPIRLKRR